MADAKICAVEGCGNPIDAKGLCSHHYDLRRRRGSEFAPLVRAKAGEGRAWLEANASHAGADCLWWPFGQGYGNVIIDGRFTKAHRYMCILAHGAPPTPRHHASHSCGNGARGCVNPNHLSWKTAAGNAADKWEHGTMPLGEQAWNARLTEESVRWARANVGRMTIKRMAQLLGVHRGTLRHAVRGDTWAWLK